MCHCVYIRAVRTAGNPRKAIFSSSTNETRRIYNKKKKEVSRAHTLTCRDTHIAYNLHTQNSKFCMHTVIQAHAHKNSI